jgi:predicted membrane channel-forming protein YqfA (hemolysin III family)
MKIQKNLFLLAAVIAFAWGLFGLFTPKVLIDFLKVPEEFINPALVSTQMSLAIAQISLGIIAIWIRSLADKKLISQAMLIVAVIFLLFGLQAVLVHLVVEGLAINMILFIEGIVFIVLGVVFFVWRKPK